MNICGVSEKGETSRAGGGEGRGLNVPPPLQSGERSTPMETWPNDHRLYELPISDMHHGDAIWFIAVD